MMVVIHTIEKSGSPVNHNLLEEVVGAFATLSRWPDNLNPIILEKLMV
jgi:hypothetical protein